MKPALITFLMIFINFGITAQNQPGTDEKVITVAGGSFQNFLPLTAGLDDGNAYVSWFRSEPGGFKLYLQYLTESGIGAFGENGMLVSGHPQPTSLSYYDLCAGKSGAVLVFTDIRGSGNLNVHAYKISPDGKNLWGPDGVTLSDDSNEYLFNPLIAKSDNEGYFVVWSVSSDNPRIEIKKVSADGAKLSDGEKNVIKHSNEESLTAYSLIPSDSGAVIVVYGSSTGMFPNMKTTIHAQKIDKNGSLLWGEKGIIVHDEGKINISMTPSVISDNKGGVIISWYSAKYITRMQSVLVQKVTSDGRVIFEKGGITVTDNADLNQFYPDAALNERTGEIIIAWTGKNGAQSASSLLIQKISSDGQLLLGGTGYEILPMSEHEISAPNLFIDDDGKEYNLKLVYSYRSEGKNNMLMLQKTGPFTDGKNDAPDISPAVRLSTPDADVSRHSGFADKTGTLRLFWESESTGNRTIKGTVLRADGSSGY